MASQLMVRLDAPSHIRVLGAVDALVTELARVSGFDDDALPDVMAAIHESLANAIVHGNHCDPSRRVTLQIELEPADIAVSVEDEGQGFDPACIPDPCLPENLSKPSGRGILLMKAFMDEVTFRCRPTGGMEVTMLKHR